MQSEKLVISVILKSALWHLKRHEHTICNHLVITVVIANPYNAKTDLILCNYSLFHHPPPPKLLVHHQSSSNFHQ